MSMRANNQTSGPSTDTFSAIFEAALTEYFRVTGTHLDTHPFAAQLETCHSPEAVSNLLRTQAQAFTKFLNSEERLMAWLNPTVRILSTFSAMLGEGISLPFSPAKTIFTGIGVLLAVVKDVVASHGTLMHLFDRVHFFLQRLNIYIGIPLTHEFTELLGQIMAQLLSILALSTKAMTDGRTKKFLKRLVGRSEVEDALLRLDSLTKEECLMTAVKNLRVTHRVDDNVQVIKALTEDIDGNMKVVEGVARSIDNDLKAARTETDELKRRQLKQELRTWLSPPDPSINHHNARKTHHDGTATWFIKSTTLREWKNNGSLLWIRGNPGAGKTVLCSAIIEDIKGMAETGSALIAYYYFDFKDASKRNVHGFLVSLLCQLGDDSEHCWEVLYQLYATCRDGFEQPSEVALVNCIKRMLELLEQVPIFVVMDALDECPINTGTPSAREEVLDLVEDLVESGHSNLFICITSRPEPDIQTILNPLTSTSTRVSLHEEGGQKDDINNYIRSFVYTDRAMRRWRDEDRELVINILSERAERMFRWVFCQLDTLRRCFPSSIRKTLDELPVTLDETYERTLHGIPKERRQHAHRLFQCLVAAVRPLRLEELGEIFAIKFDDDATPNLMEGWRPENAEEAVLSACTTLVSVVYDEGYKIVQFSHFSVKEFLTSDRLLASDDGNIRHYYIPLDAAHTILARACLAVLLQLDEKPNKKRLAGIPLAIYAARYWVDHAKFDGVASRVKRAMEQLFNPSKPYLIAWTSIYNIDFEPKPFKYWSPGATPLYYAVLCGFSELVNYLISTHGEDVNIGCGTHKTPLHAASFKGHVETARILLDHGADVDIMDSQDRTPLCIACDRKHLEVMRLLIGYGADVDVQYDGLGLLSHYASFNGDAEVIRLLLRHGADVNAVSSHHNWTPLHFASRCGRAKVAEVLLEHGACINALAVDNKTPLNRASYSGCLEVVRLLLRRGANVHIQTKDGKTPFQAAISMGNTEIAQLLLKHGAEAE